VRIRIIDAFTDRPFAGNPAGVCLLDVSTWPDQEWMRRVAAELSHETAFAHPLPDGADANWALRRHGIRGIIVTAVADKHSTYDFVSRYFAPEGGIPEDPVTGSAHTALAPYCSPRLGQGRLTGLQASDRTGLVHTEVRGDRVDLTGHAVTVLDGTLKAHVRI
jgi:predicted PhzF superfamily epimerase YddE/YHI9